MDRGQNIKEVSMKGQDIVVLLKLISLQKNEETGGGRLVIRDSSEEQVYSVRGLETSLGISKSEIHNSINRSIFSGLGIKDYATTRIRPNNRIVYNFIVHGLKYVFPVKPGSITRGVPTMFAAPMLKGLLVSPGEYINVWPHAEGESMGHAVEPLFKSVPGAVQEDQFLYECLALIDAIRLGKPREAGLAAELLAERILK